jgi:hypothetical protein
MPWKVSSVMEERLRFVGRLLDGESMSDVCGSSVYPARQVTRSQDLQSVQGARLVRSDRPLAPAGALCQPVASASREPDCQPEARQAALGARKIRELLVRRLNGDVRVPAKSTIHAVLDRHGLVRRMSKRRNRATLERRSQRAWHPTICGAPTTRASSVSATGLGAIR